MENNLSLVKDKFKVKISLHSEVDAEIIINVESADNIK